MNSLKHIFKNESGQGLVEYSLILSLVALAVVGTVIILGESVYDLYEAIKVDLINAL